MKIYSLVFIFICLFPKLTFSQTCTAIGVIGEFKRSTGSDRQPFGLEIMKGISIALKKIKDHCFQLEYIDINNTVANIPDLIKKYAEAGINLFLGLGNSNQAILATKALNETGSILITPTASSELLLSQSNRIIMIYPRNKHIADALASTISNTEGAKVSIIYAYNEVYSKGIFKIFKKILQKRKIQIINEIPVRSGKMDVQNIFYLLNKKISTHLFIPMFEIDAAIILSELEKGNHNYTIIGSDSWGSYSRILNKLSPKKNRKIILPKIYHHNIETSLNKYFVEKYRNRYKENPTDLSAFSFESLLLINKIIKACPHEITDWDIEKCLALSMPFDATTGKIIKAEGLSLKRSVKIRTTTN